MYCVLFICLSFITITLSEKVIWLPSTSFNLPINFNDGKIPCSKKTVVFPSTLDGDVVIESGTSVGGFVLPENGEIFLAEGEIGLGSAAEDVECTAGNVYYTEKTVSSWDQPDVWASPRINDATPDVERVPCFNDIVEFPANSTFTVMLPDILQEVEAIKVGEQTIHTNFKGYVLSDLNEQFILNKFHDTGIVLRHYIHGCKSRSGCPCQAHTLNIDCSAKFCKKPTCFDPIQPIGHCCKICGGAIAFDIDESFDMMQFRDLVDKIVDNYGKDNLAYHIGRLVNDKVQVVVVDKSEYDQTSTVVISAISNNMDQDLKHAMKVSGSPLSKSGFGGKIFISMFFAVVLVMAGIYVYYYKLPQVNFAGIINRRHASMFSRFDRRTDSVVSLTRRDSAAAPIASGSGTAFRNPLYDSKRGRVIVEESEMEE